MFDELFATYYYDLLYSIPTEQCSSGDPENMTSPDIMLQHNSGGTIVKTTAKFWNNVNSSAISIHYRAVERFL